MSRVNILGVEIDSLSADEVLATVDDFLKSRSSHFITTPNPEILLASRHDQEFKNILNQSDLSLPDGFGLILASYYLKRKIKQRLTGVDLMVKICRLAAEKNCSVYLLGAPGRVAEKTAEKLLEKFPGLKIVGVENGFRFWGWRLPDRVLVEKINRVRPDILFVAFGAPKQEKWLYYFLPKMSTVKIGMGVGGSFDFISGRVRRAPSFMRKMGLEWLFRLLVQPWRLPRIINATLRFSHEIIKYKRKQNE